MNERDLTTKLLATVGELAVIAALFPYQITVNRKERSFSMRSLLLHIKSERRENESGNPSRSVTFSMPGFAFQEAVRAIENKIPQKTTKKKLVLRRKVKKTAENEEE